MDNELDQQKGHNTPDSVQREFRFLDRRHRARTDYKDIMTHLLKRYGNMAERSKAPESGG